MGDTCFCDSNRTSANRVTTIPKGNVFDYSVKMPGRRKCGPRYLGGCFILPQDLSLYFNTNEINQLESSINVFTKGTYNITLNELFLIINKVLIKAIPQIRIFFYILYPISNPSWLLTSTHIDFMFRLYSVLNFIVCQQSENPMLDVGVFPVVCPQAPSPPNGISLVSPIQSDGLTALFSVNDPSTARFVDRRQRDGPIAFFRFLPDNERFDVTSLLHDGSDHQSPDSFRSPSPPVPSEPRMVSLFSNAILHLARVRCSIVPHIVDASQYLADDYIPSPPYQVTSTIPPIDIVNSSLIGGTFDHLHPGHKFLLSMMALISRKCLAVAVVNDESFLLDKKVGRGMLQPFEYRLVEVVKFTQLLFQLLNIPTRVIPPANFLTRFSSTLCPNFMMVNQVAHEESQCVVDIEMIELSDPFGPAVERCDIDCLVVTDDTKIGGDLINKRRSENGLPPLHCVMLPLLENRENQEESVGSESRVSSTRVRERLTSTPMIRDLSSHLNLVTATLGLPSLMSAVWSIRLLEHFALPWRFLNRRRLHQVLDQLWNQTRPQILTNLSICQTDKAWLSMIFTFSLCVISEEVRSEQWKIEQRISREKLREIIRLFCDDYSLAMELGLAPQINQLWRTKESRLNPINRKSIDVKLDRTPDDGDDVRGAKTDLKTTEIVSTPPKASRSIEVTDLKNNLIFVGEYLLTSFVPKPKQIDSAVLASPESKTAKTLIEVIREEEDQQIRSIYGADLLHHFQQTIDYFVYEFFIKSYQSEYASFDDMDTPPASAI